MRTKQLPKTQPPTGPEVPGSDAALAGAAGSRGAPAGPGVPPAPSPLSLGVPGGLPRPGQGRGQRWQRGRAGWDRAGSTAAVPRWWLGKYGGGQGLRPPHSHPDKGTQLAGAPAARSNQTQHLFVGSSPPPAAQPRSPSGGSWGTRGGLGSQLPHGDRTPHPTQCCGEAILVGGSAANHITSLPPGCKVPPSTPSPSRAWGAPPCHRGQRRPPLAGELVGAGAGHGPPQPGRGC